MQLRLPTTRETGLEVVWDAWLQSKTREPDGAFYAEWKEWFDRIQQIIHETADLVPWSVFNQHEADFSAHGDLANTYRFGKDHKGIFTTLEWHRQDGTLAKRSVLSGGNSPQYENRTVPIRVLSPGLDLLGEVDNYLSLSFSRSYHSVGEFQLVTNRRVQNADQLVLNNLIMLGADPRKTGIIRHKEIKKKSLLLKVTP